MNKVKRSNNYFNNLKKYLAGGVHYNFRLPWEEKPIPFIKGKDSRLWDLDGNEYLDLYAKFGAMILGHNNKKYNDFLKEWIDKILSVNHSDIDEEVSEKLVNIIPCAELIRFGLSGTEIVQNALRVARAYTGKNKFIRFIGHYHGNADNIMGGKMKSESMPVPVDFKGDYKGTDGRAEKIMENQSFLIPWNNIEILKEVVNNHEFEIAAIIMEPICINGGSILPQKNYLKEVRNLCDKHNIVLIFDEIITGFRVGLKGAQGKLDVLPDLATYGKAIGGGGLPVSVLAGKKEIMRLLEEKKVIHAGTFNGYPLGLAAIKATIDILEKPGVYENMESRTKKIHDILRKEAINAGIPLVIQGPINCASYHCCEKEIKDVSEWTYEIMTKDAILNSQLAKNGLLISTISRIYPNISLSDEDVEFFKEKIKNGMSDSKKIFDEIFL